MKRTTAMDVLRLAFHLLWTCRYQRKWLRIGQQLVNCSGTIDLFYIENASLIERVSKFNQENS